MSDHHFKLFEHSRQCTNRAIPNDFVRIVHAHEEDERKENEIVPGSIDIPTLQFLHCC